MSRYEVDLISESYVLLAIVVGSECCMQSKNTVCVLLEYC